MHMRSVALMGCLGALTMGLATGMILRPPSGAEGDIIGPQLVYSTASGVDNERGEGWWTVRDGPVGDWVYGTAWVHPKDPVYDPAATDLSPIELAPTPLPAPAAYVPPA